MDQKEGLSSNIPKEEAVSGDAPVIGSTPDTHVTSVFRDASGQPWSDSQHRHINSTQSASPTSSSHHHPHMSSLSLSGGSYASTGGEGNDILPPRRRGSTSNGEAEGRPIGARTEAASAVPTNTTTSSSDQPRKPQRSTLQEARQQQAASGGGQGGKTSIAQSFKLPTGSSSFRLPRQWSLSDSSSKKAQASQAEGADGLPASASDPSSSSSASSFTTITTPTTNDNGNTATNRFLKSAPRDLGEGLLGGFKSIAMGTLAGVAGLVAMPVMGAVDNGAPGFFMGLGAGIVGAVVMPVAGVVNGVSEIVGGLANTPETVVSTAQGMEWDPIQRKWVKYNLQEEAARVSAEEKRGQEVLAAATASGSNSSTEVKRTTTTVKETKYYDLIGVSPAAGQEEIKKAYYKAARRCHPDKNPDDAEAHQKFQALSQAYQVLSNEQLRAAYDRDGEEATSDVSFIDPALFFNVLFGSEKFEPYVGQLKMAKVASSIGDMVKKAEQQQEKQPSSTSTPTPPSSSASSAAAFTRVGEGQGTTATAATASSDPSSESLPDTSSYFEGQKSLRVQNARQVKCAVHLANLLEPYVVATASIGEKGQAGPEQQEKVIQFQERCQKEAEELSKGAFGPVMLCEIGWLYENQAQEYMGDWMDGLIARTARSGATMKRSVDVAGATIGALKAAKDISDTMPKENWTGKKKGEPSVMTPQKPEDMAKVQAAMDHSIPVFIDVVWKLSAYDIQATIVGTCKKLLRDHSVSEATRKKRAQALHILGTTFRKVGLATMSTVENDAKKQVEDAMQKVMAVSQGQEI